MAIVSRSIGVSGTIPVNKGNKLDTTGAWGDRIGANSAAAAAWGEEGEEGEGGDCAEREIEGCSSDDDVQGGAAEAGSADGAQ